MKVTLETINRMKTDGIIQFVESGVLDPKKLEIILSRHELLAKWRSFQERYFPNGGEER